MSGSRDSLEPFDPNLHRRMEARVRRELESAESEAALLAARRRRLVDVVWEAAQSGSRIHLSVGNHEVTGMPVYVRNDLMSLETPAGRVEVYLPNVDTLSVTTASAEGRSILKDVETFAARIAMLELTREHIEIVCRGGRARFEGTLEHVARDHVSLACSRGTVLVALEAIAYLVVRADSR